MSISQRLQILADDLPQTLRIAAILKKLGMKSRVIEPRDNPEFAGQDIDELKKSNDLWEVVEAFNKHLAVTIYITMDAGLSAEIGVYQRYLFNEDVWTWLIVQLKSTRPQKIGNIVNIIKQLLPLAEDTKALAAKLIELNKTLHWYKSARVKQVEKETKAADTVIYGKQHHGHVTVAVNPNDNNQPVKARCMGPASCQVCQQEWREKYTADYPNKQITANDKSKEIVDTILQQLGNNKFIVMTGARNMVRLTNGLQFDLPARMTKNKANRMTITLDNDEYILSTFKYYKLNLRPLEVKKGVQASNLRQAFTAMTNLDIHL